MRKIKRPWLVMVSIYIFAIASGAVIAYFNMGRNIGEALAGIGHNVRGFAWSSNMGWISFNSMDCDADDNHLSDGIPVGCPTAGTSIPDYGVAIDVNGDFSGYAWSNNIGWISFNATTTTPGAPTTGPKKNISTGAVTGWAKIMSLGDDGWIKFSASSTAPTTIGGTGEFTGWGWNGNNNGAGIGWISFNCSNETGGCTASNNHKVSVEMPSGPEAPTNLTVEEEAGTCKQALLRWVDNSSDETGFEVQKCLASSGCALDSNYTKFCPGDPFTTLDPDNESCSGPVASSTSYKFRVRALGATNSSWETTPTPVAIGYCPPTLPSANALQAASNCDGTNLSWTQNGSGVSYYNVYRQEAAAGSCDGNGSNCSAWGSRLNSSNIVPATPTTFKDTTIRPGKKYYYKVTAMTLDYASIVGPVNPCPNLPSWREAKSQ